MPAINLKSKGPAAWLDPQNASIMDPTWKKAVRGLSGLFGGGDPSSELLQAPPVIAMPLGRAVPPMSAPVKTLINMLRKGPVGEAIPEIALEAEKMGGLVPHRAPITPPAGFEFGEGVNGYASRPDALVEKYVNQRNVRGPAAKEVLQPASGPPLLGKPSYQGPRAHHKANPDMVRAIRALKQAGSPAADIRTKYPDIRPTTLDQILSGESWGWVK